MFAFIEMLRRRMTVTWTGYALAFIFAAAIPATNWLTLRTAMGDVRIAMTDSRDTTYLFRAGTFETAQAEHEDIAKLAAETMFARNPDGYDFEERKARLFTPEALKALNDDTGRDAVIFKDQQIHQKVEFHEVHEIPVDDKDVKVGVDCQVVRTGLLGASQFSDSKKLTVFFMLRLNDDCVHNGMYPAVVSAYKVHYE